MSKTGFATQTNDDIVILPTPDTNRATTALDNLATVAINTSLVSDTHNTDNLGSEAKAWKELYLGDGGISFEGSTDDGFQTTVNIVDPTADNAITIPDATDTLIGKATTDTLTNKTFDANGTGNSISNVDMSADVTGILPVVNGGTNASSASITAFNNITGYTSSGATGTTSTNVVFSTSPTLTTPQSNDLTITGSAASTPDANTLTKDHMVGARCVFDGTGTPAYTEEINFSGAITDNGTGSYTLSIDRDFASANYSSLSNAGEVSLYADCSAHAAGAITIGVRNESGTLNDTARISVVLIGAQ